MDQEGQEQQSTSVSSETSALKTSEKGTKKTSKVLIPILIIIALAGVGFGVYGMFLKPEPTTPSCPTCVAENPEKPEEPTPQETPDQTKQNKDLTIGRSFDDVVNNKQETYYNTYSEIEAKPITVLDKNGDKNYDFFYINCNSDICKIFNEKGEETTTIDNFQGKIRDFYYIVFGQAYGSEKLYFVMEDGSVEYIPVDEAFNTNNIKSYGKIVGLSDIVKIHQVSQTSLNNNTPLSNGAGALAEDKEGKFYDLAEPLE